MNQVRRSRGIKAILYAIVAGILVRLGIFTNNFYYPDIGMPYTLGIPAVATILIGILVYSVYQLQ